MLSAQQLDQLVVDDFDQLLAGRQTGRDLLPQDLGLDPLDKVADDPKVHVGLEQRQTHFTQRLLDILFGQCSRPTHPAQDGVQFFAQRFKHRNPRRRTGAPLTYKMATGKSINSSGGLLACKQEIR